MNHSCVGIVVEAMEVEMVAKLGLTETSDIGQDEIGQYHQSLLPEYR